MYIPMANAFCDDARIVAATGAKHQPKLMNTLKKVSLLYFSKLKAQRSKIDGQYLRTNAIHVFMLSVFDALVDMMNIHSRVYKNTLTSTLFCYDLCREIMIRC